MPRVREYCSKIFLWLRLEAYATVLFILDTLYFIFQPIIEELVSCCLFVLAYIRSQRVFWLFRGTSLRILLGKHVELLVFAFAFLLEIGFGLLLVDKYGSTFSGADSVSYIYIARNAIDNGVFSGLSVLVGNWPPLFSLFQLPLVMVDILYTTGFSGTIVNAFMTGGTALFLFRLAGGMKNRFALLAPLLFLSNVYVLLFGAIPMTEQPALFFLVAASYFFKDYWNTGNIRGFIKCSFLLILGSLTRYEIWAVSVFIVFIFLFKEMLGKHTTYRLGYAHLPLWGILAWMLTNYLIHRDPLRFNTQFLSNRMLTTIYPTYFKDSAYLTIKHAFLQMDLVFGFLLYLAIVSIILILVFGRAREIIPLTIFSIPSLVQVVLMFQGQSFGFARYFYTLIPGLILPVVYFLERAPVFFDQKGILNILRNIYLTPGFRLSFLFISLFIGISMIALALQPGSSDIGDKNIEQGSPWIFQGLDISNSRIFPNIRNEGYLIKSDLYFESPDMYKEYSSIKKLLGSERVLMSSDRAIVSELSTSQGISPSQIIDDFDYLDYERVMQEPWNHTRFVLVYSIDPEYARVVNDWYHGNFYLYNYYFNDAWRSTFLSYYEQVFESKDIKLFRLRTSRPELASDNDPGTINNDSGTIKQESPAKKAPVGNQRNNKKKNPDEKIWKKWKEDEDD